MQHSVSWPAVWQVDHTVQHATVFSFGGRLREAFLRFRHPARASGVPGTGRAPWSAPASCLRSCLPPEEEGGLPPGQSGLSPTEGRSGGFHSPCATGPASAPASPTRGGGPGRCRSSAATSRVRRTQLPLFRCKTSVKGVRILEFVPQHTNHPHENLFAAAPRCR